MKEVQIPQRINDRISDFDTKINEYLQEQVKRLNDERTRFVQNLIEGFVAGLEDVADDAKIEVNEDKILIYTPEEFEAQQKDKEENETPVEDEGTNPDTEEEVQG